ncbi:unnamed protein product [Rhizoctonia solani]|uniref:Uncharacterized protein n=1 Tax=Rhizoctonia solani TaxID=456999 RepID=A0A8H2WDR7_9AGAM|nr:unnamed protein product [Rhizoctonia solani]
MPSDILVFIHSRLQVSPAYGKVVGVGVPSGQSVTPYIRLDMEPKGADPTKDKGIHFNAVKLSDSSAKLAGVIQTSIALDDKARTDLYMQHVKALENRSVQLIWDWWRTGVAG